MAGTRQPTALVVAKGRKHLTKAEIAEREASEVKLPPAQRIKAPKWVPEALKKDFKEYARALADAGLYADLDADTLGRYLIAHQEWLAATSEAQKALQRKDIELADAWSKLQERYFKQARNCANDMGLTITSRCRLVMPQPQEKEEDNPFLKLVEYG